MQNSRNSLVRFVRTTARMVFEKYPVQLASCSTILLSACFSPYDTKTVVDSDGNGLIEIHSIEQLSAIRNSLDGISLNGAVGGCPKNRCHGFELAADLDFSALEDGHEFRPIGDIDNAFSAIFDGNGFEIRNLSISVDDQFTALFGKSENAEFRNLSLTNVSIQSKHPDGAVGSLVAHANNSKVTNCYIQGRLKGVGRIGGVVGELIDGTMENCTVDIEIVAHDSTVGGLVGYSSNSRITGNEASVDIQAGGRGVGGAVGRMVDQSELSNTQVKGYVSGRISLGGIVGSMYRSALFRSSSRVHVNGLKSLEGMDYTELNRLYNSANSIEYSSIGGLAGIADKSQISESHAGCQVTGLRNVGGLVGLGFDMEMQHLYFIGEVSGYKDVGVYGGSVSNTSLSFAYGIGPSIALNEDAFPSDKYLFGSWGSNTRQIHRGTSILETAHGNALEEWRNIERSLNSDTRDENIQTTFYAVPQHFQEAYREAMKDYEFFIDIPLFEPEHLARATPDTPPICPGCYPLFLGWDRLFSEYNGVDVQIWDFGNEHQLPTITTAPELHDCPVERG